MPSWYAPTSSADHLGGAPFTLTGSRPLGCVLVHGFGATPEEVRDVGAAIAAAGHPVHGVLLPGHGATIAEFGAHGHEAWLAGVDDALDAMRSQTGSVALLGMSLGALLALAVAARRPGSVAALVLCGTALAVRDRRAAWLGRLARLPLLADLLPALPKPGGRDISDARARDSSPAHAWLPLRAIGALVAVQHLAASRLGDVRQPALILHGRHDHAVPVEVVDRLRADLGSTWIESHILERSWHVVTRDVEADMVAHLTVDFLGRVEATLG